MWRIESNAIGVMHFAEDRVHRPAEFPEDHMRLPHRLPAMAVATARGEYLLENASTRLAISCGIPHTNWGEAECEFINYACEYMSTR